MKYNKNADTLLLLLFFTTGQREKNIEKTFASAGAQKGEKQRVLGVLYRNIYRILKVNFHIYGKYICLTFNCQKCSSDFIKGL